ncbi:hypothetical protein PXO_01785 [Xanthomonas oryzae pv. oryzae PXO99A]|uniref:Uncharacterized protein n=1 Tax=Xanthomonas oryzae pv. oryzae (strain PXO99A) TaxID=360094 RepID=A0A0K0GL03_XANOP|nr:hypothetical protein PXO_01785 [Xanthomonas oryzae pv. oryzae PXO99A]
MRQLRQDVPDGEVVGRWRGWLAVVGDGADGAAAARRRMATGGLAARGERA